VLLASASTAIASPKGKKAKAAFDRGVVAYQKENYAGASEALAQSYKLEPDVETLYAWAQSERQQNKCESAIELYNKLLATDMPEENKDAVRQTLAECKAIVAAKTGGLDKPLDKPVDKPLVEKPVDKPVVEEKKIEEPKRDEAVEPARLSGKPWYKDPIGDALTVGGVVSLGVGAYFLYSGKQAEDASLTANKKFRDEQDKAESRGRIGVVLTITGAALVTGGIVRYMTRSSSKKETAVTGWVTPDSGGLAAFGRF
jgi:tetratricopeptide (TPR) repeat protein